MRQNGSRRKETTKRWLGVSNRPSGTCVLCGVTCLGPPDFHRACDATCSDAVKDDDWFPLPAGLMNGQCPIYRLDLKIRKNYKLDTMVEKFGDLKALAGEMVTQVKANKDQPEKKSKVLDYDSQDDGNQDKDEAVKMGENNEDEPDDDDLKKLLKADESR